MSTRTISTKRSLRPLCPINLWNVFKSSLEVRRQRETTTGEEGAGRTAALQSMEVLVGGQCDWHGEGRLTIGGVGGRRYTGEEAALKLGPGDVVPPIS